MVSEKSGDQAKEVPLASIMNGTLPVPIPPEVDQAVYAPSITIRDGNERFSVPTDALAARAHVQLTLAKVRHVFNRMLEEKLKDNGAPDILTVQRITNVASTLQEMQLNAYLSSSKSLPENSNAFERLAIGVVRAAAEGVSRGAHDTFEDKMKKIRRLGKCAPPKTVEAVVEKPAENSAQNNTAKDDVIDVG